MEQFVYVIRSFSHGIWGATLNEKIAEEIEKTANRELAIMGSLEDATIQKIQLQ